MTKRNYNLPSSTKSKGVHVSFNEEHVVSCPFENLIKKKKQKTKQTKTDQQVKITELFFGAEWKPNISKDKLWVARGRFNEVSKFT